MSGSSLKKTDYDITSTYDLCVRAFRTTRKLLKLNIKLHDDAQQPCHQTIEQGDIFLFNHFARFETFIPQYLIHAETGSYCRSIASSEFFEDSRFAPFLRSIGVVPNDMPDLFPFIAKEILHGRKLVIFPEGGMVKDKRVVDDKGRFGIYSRTAMERRKHHRGAAVIALAVDAFKTALLRDYSTGNYQQIERWAEQLEFPNTESLLMKALKPTSIVPSHITFYPIRVNDNILHQAAKLFNKGINKRFAEELIIEGNLLFRHTDMDIRFSTPLIIGKYWKWWEKQLLPNVVHRFESIQELFNLTPASGHWGGRIHSIGMKAKSNLVRDDYMQAMYKAVTINLSHIASYLILQY
ncbi:MAG: alpha/beta hydrolase, partial [Gammaproteobacteria bacterium]|nr:alpha/beta hydrolase [Gammaproteobacteria bacterium]